MVCLKCEEGELKKVQFMPNGLLALLCDNCQTVWSDNDVVSQSSGQALHSYVPEDGYEYYIDIFDDKDQEFQEITGKLI